MAAPAVAPAAPPMNAPAGLPPPPDDPEDAPRRCTTSRCHGLLESGQIAAGQRRLMCRGDHLAAVRKVELPDVRIATHRVAVPEEAALGVPVRAARRGRTLVSIGLA